jgi:MFS family permease
MVQASNWLFKGDWRAFWYTEAAVAVTIGVLCTFLTGSKAWLARRSAVTDAQVAADAVKPTSRVHRSLVNWTVKEAIRTPQFLVLFAAYFGHLLIGVTVASLSVAHLTELGVTAAVAGAMLSFESLVQTAGRVTGGLLGDRLDPKYLLVFALGSLVVGSAVLSVANTYPLMIIYAAFTGLGFGLTALAVTVLLLNYFGRKHNLEIFSTTCLVGAVSALGPVIGGAMRDQLGGFSATFQLFAGLIFLVFVAALFMRPPRRAEAPATEPDLSAQLANDAV